MTGVLTGVLAGVLTGDLTGVLTGVLTGDVPGLLRSQPPTPHLPHEGEALAALASSPSSCPRSPTFQGTHSTSSRQGPFWSSSTRVSASWTLS